MSVASAFEAMLLMATEPVPTAELAQADLALAVDDLRALRRKWDAAQEAEARLAGTSRPQFIGLRKVLAGKTTLEEVLRVTNEAEAVE